MVANIPFDRFIAGPADERAIRERLIWLGRLLDSRVRLPGTNLRIGLDPLLGLVPGIGDTVSTALSAYLIYEARRLGMPKRALARMVGNVAVDAMVGAIPIVGDAFDLFWRSNERNLRLIERYLDQRGPGPVIDGIATRGDKFSAQWRES